MTATLLTKKSDILFWLEERKITVYNTLFSLLPSNEGFIIEVADNINLSNFQMTHLPVQFGRVKGKFSCDNCKLETLKGAPHFVGGSFSCSWNRLETLEYAPATVGENFLCHHNMLKNFKHAPVIVPGRLGASVNHIATLEHAPQAMGHLEIQYNPFKAIQAYTEFEFECTGNISFSTEDKFMLQELSDYYDKNAITIAMTNLKKWQLKQRLMSQIENRSEAQERLKI